MAASTGPESASWVSSTSSLTDEAGSPVTASRSSSRSANSLRRSSSAGTFTDTETAWSGQRGGVLHRAPDDPRREVAHQGALVGHVEERLGRQDSAGRVVPADERLEAEQQPVVADQGLVVQRQLAGEERVPQLALHRQLGPALRLVVVDAPAAPARPPGPLGVVHRGVGMPEQVARVHRRALRRHHPQRGRHDDAVPGDLDGCADRLEDPAGQDVDLLVAVHLLADDDELVAAEPGDRVGSRTASARLWATAASRASPASWPRESLTRFTWSRSRNSTATSRPSRRDRASAWPSRSRSSLRFGSPVRLSCSAACSSRPSTSREAVTSSKRGQAARSALSRRPGARS